MTIGLACRLFLQNLFSPSRLKSQPVVVCEASADRLGLPNVHQCAEMKERRECLRSRTQLAECNEGGIKTNCFVNIFPALQILCNEIICVTRASHVSRVRTKTGSVPLSLFASFVHVGLHKVATSRNGSEATFGLTGKVFQG